jgi:pantoate kinase
VWSGIQEEIVPPDKISGFFHPTIFDGDIPTAGDDGRGIVFGDAVNDNKLFGSG